MKVFGFELFNKKKEVENFKPLSMNLAVKPENEDGAFELSVLDSLHNTFQFSIDLQNATEIQKIRQYREIAMEPEVDQAIDEVINEAIVLEDNYEVIKINLDELEDYSEEFKETLREEFNTIIRLLDFNLEAYNLFRRWYIDGRLFLNKIIDNKNPKKGLQKLILISPFHIRKIREIVKEINEHNIEVVKEINEFFVYDPIFNFSNRTALKLPIDSVCYVHSGLLDEENKIVLSYLEKAIKSVNQLRQMEDANIIYRLARAPERRVFYVDVAGLPKGKAEQYIYNLMAKFKNKLTYDAITGKVKDARNQLSMMEDFWIPRRTEGKTAEIQTLPGASNTDQTEEVKYFLNKVYSSLNVPVSRLNSETPSGITFGRSAEITRDELRFGKFIRRLHSQFSNLFFDLLRTQLLLKNIVSISEWDTLKSNIKFEFEKDNYYTNSKNAAILKDKLEMMNNADSLVGKYLSVEFIYENIMEFNTEEIEEEKRRLAIESGKQPEENSNMNEFSSEGGTESNSDFGLDHAESMPPPEKKESAETKETKPKDELDFMTNDLKSMKNKT